MRKPETKAFDALDKIVTWVRAREMNPESQNRAERLNFCRAALRFGDPLPELATAMSAKVPHRLRAGFCPCGFDN